MDPRRWWDLIRLRLRTLLRGQRVDDELNEELQFHLEQQIAENIAGGLAHDHARREALRRLEGLDGPKEACRDARGINVVDHLARDVRGAVRLLRRDPGFCVVSALSLALGIGANATIFQLLDAIRLKPLAVEKPGDLALVEIANRGWPTGDYGGRYPSLTYPLWEQLTTHAEPFVGLLAWSPSTIDLATGGESRFSEDAIWVNGDFFATLGVGPAIGRVFAARDDQPGCAAQVVLSHAFWQRAYGGSADVIGSSITLNGMPYAVIGVAARGFYGVEVGRSFDLAMPFCSEPLMSPGSTRLTDRTRWWIGVIGRLKPEWSRERATVYLESVSPGVFAGTVPADHSPDDATQYRGFKLIARNGSAGFSQLRETYDSSLWLLLAVAGVVLLIACANLANLMLARMSARERELSVRLAIGASRARLIQQLVVESLMLAAIGTAAAAFLSPVLGSALVSLISTDVNPMFVDLAPDWRVIGFLASLAVVSTLLFGLAPAVRAARVPPGEVMKSGGRGLVGRRTSLSFNRSLVAVQVALSVVLLVAGLLFARSLFNLMTVDMGFAPTGILEVDVDMRALNLAGPARSTLRDEIVRRIRDLPDVANAATVVSVPFVGNWYRPLFLPGTDGHKRVQPRFNRVSAGYFDTMSTPIIAGRDFDASDVPSSPRVAIVNNTFVREHLGDAQPIGLEFRPGGPRGEPGPTVFRIVGVAGDTKHGNLREAFGPIVYVSESQVAEASQYLNIFVRMRGSIQTVRPEVSRAVAGANARMSFHFHDVDEIRRNSLGQERLMALLCGAFALLGGVLATIGVYGVIAYSAGAPPKRDWHSRGARRQAAGDRVDGDP